MIDEFKQAVEYLATKLEQPAAKLYEIFIRQSYVDGYKQLGLVVFLLLAAVALFFIGKFGLNKYNKAQEASWRNGEEWFWLIIPGFIGGVALTIAFVVNLFGDWWTALLNPEYYALTKLFSLIK